jgi:hypothetical protein
MGQRVIGDDELIRTSDVISHACKYIGNFGKFAMNLQTAVVLIELIQVNLYFESYFLTHVYV